MLHTQKKATTPPVQDGIFTIFIYYAMFSNQNTL